MDLSKINTLGLLKEMGKKLFSASAEALGGDGRPHAASLFEKTYLGTNENTGERIRPDNYRFGELPDDSWVNLSSTNLDAMKYVYDTELLTVRFKSKGSEYDYYGVPPYVAMGLFRAISHGSYHYHNIRMSYVYVKLA